MALLAVDTGGLTPAIALLDDKSNRYIEFGALPYGASGEGFFRILRGLLADCGLDMRSIHAACVYTGPGGFTGVRIGLSVLAGMRAGSGLPLYGIDGFTLAAFTAPPAKEYRICIPGGRGTAYAAVLDADYKMIRAPEIIALSDTADYMKKHSGDDDVSAVRVKGNRADNIADIADAHTAHLTVRDMIRLYKTRPDVCTTDAALQPVYVRPPDATPKKDVKRNL